MTERLYGQPSYTDILAQLKAAETDGRERTPLRLAFLRNITLDPVVTCTRYQALQSGFEADIFQGEYDNAVQEVLDDNSPLYAHRPEVIILGLYQGGLAEDLSLCFASLEGDRVEAEVDRLIDHFRTILAAIRRRTEAVILVHGLETPPQPAFGVLDYQDRAKQAHTFRRLNLALLDLAQQYDGVYLIDLDLILARLGQAAYFDRRYWHIGRSPYSRQTAWVLAGEYMKFIRAIKGKNKKCLVLDADNTLWGGIVGEDGLSGIAIGPTHPGSAFREFQKACLNLYNRGVMLAICSKNNEADVLEVLDSHPDMVLKRNHFVSTQINWDDKGTNLRRVAQELNIGLDSLVFLDDSEFEINLVRQMVPEVEAICLPPDPTAYRDLVESLGLFDSLTFSDVDRKRNEMYRQEVERKKAATSFDPADLTDYYGYLEMKVTIRFGDEFSLPRIAQLTQRTNQWNLTTRRYSESDIGELYASDAADVLYLKLEDRFGDTGIVGVGIIRYRGEEAEMDSFLLSCRVIGRGVEDIFIAECARRAAQKGAKRLTGVYLPTAKNAQVAPFYAGRGFEPLEEGEGGGRYVWDLTGDLPRPEYFASIDSEV